VSLPWQRVGEAVPGRRGRQTAVQGRYRTGKVWFDLNYQVVVVWAGQVVVGLSYSGRSC